ncbi:hypothetical protein AGOR_G00033300 [Albula goreensis]|uniref:Uncharacterized protein n=1 Tax=Albula goreensis TaxID=1534307 RepID=A0A8T3E368_9TELE|nr:hypothetical protein AGOR_G00033300 [Albula goreensis]
MSTGSSDSHWRQVEHMETIEECEEEEDEEDWLVLVTRRQGRRSRSLVKQSTPAQSEESRFTASVTLTGAESTSGEASLSPRSLRLRLHTHGLLPSLQEEDDTPQSSSQRHLWSGGPSTAEFSLGPGLSAAQDVSWEDIDSSWMEPARGKVKQKRGPNRRLSMRAEDGELTLSGQKKKRTRKPRNKMPSVIPEWLAYLMHSIEEATHHELTVE